MKNDTKAAAIIMILLSLFILRLGYLDIKKTNDIGILQQQNDSLRQELFSTQAEVGRYEVGIIILSERNPSASKQLEKIISEETE